MPPIPSPTGIILPSETATYTPIVESPSATIDPPSTSTATVTVTFTAAPSATPSLIPTPSKEDIQRALIISFDGMRPDAIPLAPMPNLMALMDEGAYAPESARTIEYPSTSPSHASMLSGLCMAQTGVIYDKFFMYMGYSKGVDIFDLAHAAKMRTVMIVSKDKLRQLAEPETTDDFEVAYGEPAIVRAVVPQIEKGFGLMFVHFAGPDLRGHKYGWMSGEYMKILRAGDNALGQIIQALKDNNLYDTTLIIVTADHGGHDKNHVGTLIEDYRIPWIIHGPGIVHQELDFPIYTMDTAATVAYALHLQLQPDWSGIPVYQAFGETQIKQHENKNPCKK